ncbi:MAG: DNA ligase D [Chitinivibrionales bacterium]|nr:DNA ligase D [Chitinivibrionales bacterium]
MTIESYRTKRDFARTPEPAGEQHAPGGHLYVIQKHAATSLHYDFRIEIDGVLRSWAVPKGPSLDPSDKRLAVHVEDHPVEYGSFEGTIPRDEYGGGTVMLWDRGSWEPEGDARRGFDKGHLRFGLHGEKLQGGWALTRMGDGNNWLLVKRRDNYAQHRHRYDILEHRPRSVTTGRTMDEIARGGEAHPQQTHAAPARDAAAPATEAPSTKTLAAGAIPGAEETPYPDHIDVQRAALAESPPHGERWIHETKYDGYRMLAFVHHDSVKLITRNDNDWTEKLPSVTQSLHSMKLGSAVLDGEVVVQTESGTSDFQALQNVLSGVPAGTLFYYVFDLLYYDGYDLRGATLRRRKHLLQHVLAAHPDNHDVVRFSGHIEGRGELVYEQACRLGLEGIIAKDRDSIYEPGRSATWLKIKCTYRQEFVVGGYTEPGGSRIVLGSLLLGYYDDKGRLRYCGRTGTGFDDTTLRRLQRRLMPLERHNSPFANTPRSTEFPATPHWLEPQTVAEVAFAGWTRDKRVRQAAFKGLREDKDPREVGREAAVAAGVGERAAAAGAAEGHTAAGDDRPGGRPPRSETQRRKDATVRLTNPDKVLYPGQGITKRALAEYYDAVASRMLPHIAGRPFMLLRCPSGRHRDCFFQKHFENHTPAHVRTARIPEAERTRTYGTIDSPEGLTALVQLGCLELHVWNSRVDRLEEPDLMIFDLDPGPGVSWQRIVEGAHLVRHRLQELGLRAWVKTSGSKGLHVAVPLAPGVSWDELLGFSGAVAEDLGRRHRSLFVADVNPARRKGRIYLDYLRNGRGTSTVAPWSTRVRPGAPISAPVAWEDIDGLVSADAFTVQNVNAALARGVDPWADMWTKKQVLGDATRREMRIH